MESLVVAGSSYLAQKVVETGVAKLFGSVVERWSRRRATEFYRGLIHELFKEPVDPSQIEAKLDQICNDEKKSELVFEAYRLVCLSRSQTIGPRVIAILTGRILQRESAVADDTEELVFSAAEALNDSDFLAFSAALDQALRNKRLDPKDISLPGDLEVIETLIDIKPTEFGDGFMVPGFGATERTQLSGDSLALRLGPWAERLRSLGLVSESRVEISQKDGGESPTHDFLMRLQGGSRRVEWRIRFNKGAFLLRDLLRVAMPGTSSS